MIFLSIVFAIQIAISGFLFKAACWLYNYFFAGSQPPPRDAATTATSVNTQTAGNEVMSENEQINPFAPPRQTAEPIITNNEPQIAVPTVGVSIGFGLLTGMQLFVFGLVLFATFEALGLGIAVGLTFVVTFSTTATFVAIWLANNFARGITVTGIYYALLLALASPLIVLLLLSYKTPQ